MLSSLEGPQLVKVERKPPVWRLVIKDAPVSTGKSTVTDPLDFRRSSPSEKDIIASSRQITTKHVFVRIEPLVSDSGTISPRARFWILIYQTCHV